MGRGGRSGLKRGSNRHVRVKSKDSEDSDEDYVAEVDEVNEQSDELELESLVRDASEVESLFDEEEAEEEEEEEDEEEEEEEWGTIEKKPRARKNKEEEEEEEEEEEWGTIKKKPMARKKPASSRRNGIERAKKRRKFTHNIDEDFVEDEDEFTSDEEFTPDEMESLEEEEDIPLPKLKTKKRRRTTLNRKSSAKKRRGKTVAKTVRKPVKKKRKVTRSFRRKAKPGSDEDSVEKGPTLRGRSKKKPVLGKKRGTVVSDSESCFEPSEYEFTISEEEREQMREANKICRSLAPKLRSSRRTQEDEVPCEPRKTSARKGKEKAEETKNDVGKPVCGICLTEEGKNTIRGTLNCCSHYFCFACIMEWSKVESRCPLCKQRFVTISKPARCVKGFDLRNVVFQVPECDQVYQPSEEELRDFLNPYENVICTECHHGGDDNLMLLCDLCDSPAHTYCVGLGREVPEGNWYCVGCRPAAPGASSYSQTVDLTPDQRASGDASYGTSTYENMADIDLNVTIPETPRSQGNGFLSSPRYSGGSFRAPSPTSGMGGVTTVSSRRRMQHQIYRFLIDRLNPGADVDNLRALLGVEVNSIFQHSGNTDAGTSRNAHRVDRLQENPPYNVENRDPIPERLGEMVGQVGLASSSADGLAHSHTRWSGLDRVNSSVSQAHVSSNGQLHPCTSGSSFGPDFHGAPFPHRNEENTNMVKQRVLFIVKRQLKSLSQDMNLSPENYAEISRKTADTIMVAYGLELPRLDSYEVQPPFCLHVERLANVEVGPIGGCCITCFENFAKDIVKRMMEITLGPQWLHFRH